MNRILVLSYEFPPLGGGGAKVVAGLCHEFRETGCEIDLVTMGFRGLPRREEIEGIKIHRIPCIRIRKDVCYFPEMIPYILIAIPYVLRLARKGAYQVNHTHFIFPDGVISWIVERMTGLPYVITAHGSDVPGYNPDRFHFLHRLLRPLWRAVTSRASRLVCPSRTLESLVLGRNPQARTAVIPNGIDLGKFDPHREREPRILIVTRMFERKGVQFVLEALRDLDLAYQVDIVGDGPYLETVQALARKYRSPARFHGFLENKGPELRNLYETASIFLFPSESENFPIVLLEAMIAGIAIITTRGTGCAEVVGDAALLVDPKSAQQIREAILELVENPALRAELGRRARSRAEEQFGAKSVAQRMIRVLDEASRAPSIR